MNIAALVVFLGGLFILIVGIRGTYNNFWSIIPGAGTVQTGQSSALSSQSSGPVIVPLSSPNVAQSGSNVVAQSGSYIGL